MIEREHRLRVTLANDPPVMAPVPAPDHTEYYYVQGIVTGFNDNCLAIKQWSVTAASGVAVIGTAADVRPSIVLAVVFLLALFFWLTETVWRMNQWAFIRYIQQLERRAGSPRISTNWSIYYHGKTPREAGDASRCPECLRLPALVRNRFGLRDAAEGREGGFRGGWQHFKKMRVALPHIFIAGFALLAFGAVISGRLTLSAKHDDPKPTEVRAEVKGTLTMAPGAARMRVTAHGRTVLGP